VAYRRRVPAHRVRKLWEERRMLHMALLFLVVALIAGVLGVTGVAGLSAQIAWILVIVGVILAVVTFLFGRRGRI
jgi:uncharacterized membrane protein YtjA (UPF0391 family)